MIPAQPSLSAAKTAAKSLKSAETTSNSSNKNGPSTLADRTLKAWHERGMIFIRFASGHEASFPTKGNPRLESAAEEDVGQR